MSRGLGRVERELFQRLGVHRDELRPELWLALDRLMEFGAADRSWCVSVRRAAASLERKGLVEKTYFYDRATGRRPNYFDPSVGAGLRRFVGIRTRLATDELKVVAELALEYEQHLERLVSSQEAGDQAAFQRALLWTDWYEAPTLGQFVVPLLYVTDESTSIAAASMTTRSVAVQLKMPRHPVVPSLP